METAEEVPVVIFIRDLMFASKVVATARAEGVAFKAVRDVSVLMNTPGRALVVDLNAPESLDAATEWKKKYGRSVVGFVAHVDRERMAAATAAGMDKVMTNGAFAGSLPQLVKQLGAI